MAISLDSLVGELHIVAGAQQSATPATHVATAPRRAARGRAEDTLYVLADLPGASSGVLGDLVQVMLTAYWATPGSVTSALRAAITAAGEWLMDRNVSAPAPDRLAGGLSCAVLRDSEVVIAQAGPASAYVAQQGTIEHYPAADEAATPLGVARANDVRFARVALQPGDVIVLTDARWPTRVPIEAVASAVVAVSAAQGLTNLAQLTGNADLIALAIEAAGATETTPVTPTPTVRPTVAPIEPAARPGPVSRPAEPAPAPAPVERPVTTLAAQAKPVTKPTPEPAATRSAAKPAAPVEEEKDTTDREPPSATAKAWLGALFQGARRGAGSVGVAGQMVVQRTLPEPVTPRGRSASAVRSSTTSRGGRKSAAQPVNTPLLAGIAIAIPILVSLLVATLFIQGNAKAELATALASAQNAITLAQQRTGADARAQWNQAIKFANQAQSYDPGNVTAADYVTAAQLGLDRLDNVIRLKPKQLWNFNSIGQHRLATQGFVVFALDRGTNEINRFTLNAAGDGLEGNAPLTVLSAKTVIEPRPSGNLLDMVWVDSSEGQSINSLVVAFQGGLLSYSMSLEWQPLDFGANTVPAGLRRMRAFNGNLYMLDPAGNQVWRYSAKGNGYPEKPEPYFAQPLPLVAKGVDLVIDGSVYVVTGDGQIAKYRGGQPETFAITDLPTPLTTVFAAAVDEHTTNSSLYLAVPGSLVQLRPDGKFVRQFRADGKAFEAVEDLLIDEQNGRVYVVSGGVLYTAVLPPLP